MVGGILGAKSYPVPEGVDGNDNVSYSFRLVLLSLILPGYYRHARWCCSQYRYCIQLPTYHRLRFDSGTSSLGVRV